MKTAPRLRLPLNTLVLCSLAAVSAGAQEQATRPTFRSGVDIVTIDVSVVDGSGRQVRDLSAGDFAVEVDGKPRKVLSVEYLEAGAAAEARAAAPGAVPRGAAPVDIRGGHQIVLAVDTGATSPERRTQILAAAGAILDRLGPADRIGVATVPLRSSSFSMAANRELARRQLEAIGGWLPRPGRGLPFSLTEALMREDRGAGNAFERVVARVCDRGDEQARDACRSNLESEATALVAEVRARTEASYGGLEVLARALSSVDGPKSVVFFSEQLFTEGVNVDAARIARIAAASRVRIDVVHVSSSITDADTSFVRRDAVTEHQRQLEGLELVADWTGGDLYPLSNPVTRTAEFVVEGLAGAYLLTIETDPADRDGKSHRINVRVPGSQVHVRARREFAVAETPTITASPVNEPATSPAPPAPPALPAPPAPPAPTRGSVFVAIDPLHVARKSEETETVLRELRAAFAGRGFTVTDTAAAASTRVEVMGQRVITDGNSAFAGGSLAADALALIRVTVISGDRIRELRGRNQGEREVTRSAAQETARLVERWLSENPPASPVPPAAAPAPSSAAVAPQQLLPNMRAYAAEYEQKLSGIVAEERYRQVFSRRNSPYPAPPVLQTREMKSEMGYAWFPDPGTWFGFRDVQEVDGKAVADRQQKLEELFIERKFPSAEQIGRVVEASARFNIGPARRNFNVPTLSLLVASPANAGRCSFELRRFDEIDGVRVAVIAFTEVASPTFIQREGHDWPSRGLLWVEPETGRIRRSDLQLAAHDMEMRLTTWFAMDERLGVLVPTRMREMYDYPDLADEYVEATATYSNYRQFGTEAKIKP